MFTFSRTRAVMLALAQVWLIVAGTLAADMMSKLFSNTALPFSLRFLKAAGVPLLALPLFWISVTMILRFRADVSDHRRLEAYAAGWALLVVLLAFIAYALIHPWTMGILMIGTTGSEEM